MAILINRTANRLLLAALVAGMLQVCAEGPSAIEEYDVKAAFLFNFAKFVEWPASAFKSADDPIKICVLGQNPFGSSLENAVRGKTFGSRAFVVQDVTNAQDAATCHILFVAASVYKRLSPIVGGLKTSTVLTVGETDDFAANGGIITFRVRDARVRFEIETSAAERAQLRISSKLLSLAQARKK